MSGSITWVWRKLIWPDLRRNIGFSARMRDCFRHPHARTPDLGAPHASDAQIFEALEVSCAAAFAKQACQGLALIHCWRQRLCPGQRQSILLAKCRYRRLISCCLMNPAPRWMNIPSGNLFSASTSGWKLHIDCRHPSRTGSGTVSNAWWCWKKVNWSLMPPESAGVECELGTCPP